MSFDKYVDCAKLNLKILRLLFSNRILRKDDVSLSYDRLSACYNENWLVHLQEVIDLLIKALPDDEMKSIVDLGCGTGYGCIELKKKYPTSKIYGIDISNQMLEIAKKNNHSDDVEYRHGDMLNYLYSCDDEQEDMIFSSFAIGYSNPGKIIKEAYRVLKPGGKLAFVVNYSSTLKPLFFSYRRTMQKFSGDLQRLILHRFPKDKNFIENLLKKNRFFTKQIIENKIIIKEKLADDEKILPWILKTGILAGFDKALPLGDNNEVSSYFEEEIHKNWEPLHHNYVMVVAEKKC